MIHSMTGFGRASGALSDRFFVAITTKSVNHRFLEVSVRLPEFFWELEPAVRAVASDALSRDRQLRQPLPLAPRSGERVAEGRVRGAQ